MLRELVASSAVVCFNRTGWLIAIGRRLILATASVTEVPAVLVMTVLAGQLIEVQVAPLMTAPAVLATLVLVGLNTAGLAVRPMTVLVGQHTQDLVAPVIAGRAALVTPAQEVAASVVRASAGKTFAHTVWKGTCVPAQRKF